MRCLASLPLELQYWIYLPKTRPLSLEPFFIPLPIAELDHIPAAHVDPPLPNPLLKDVPLAALEFSLAKPVPLPKVAKGFLVCDGVSGIQDIVATAYVP